MRSDTILALSPFAIIVGIYLIAGPEIKKEIAKKEEEQRVLMSVCIDRVMKKHELAKIEAKSYCKKFHSPREDDIGLL